MRTPDVQVAGAPHSRANNRQRMSLRDLLFRLRAFIALILLVITFSLLSPAFLTTGNLLILAKHVAINALLAIGMTFVILTGGIDLSVGSIVGLAGMIAGGLINQGLVLPMFGVVVYFSIWMIILITLVLGMLMGGLNGWMITRFNVAPFIATLGMLYVARGFAMLRSNGATFPNLVGKAELGNTGFPVLGAGTMLGIPLPIWIMVLFAAVAAVVASRTPFGRQVFAIGGNERAAELSGVRVKRVKLAVYMISGFCAAMTGLIVASQLVASHPATGETFELNAIAAVVLGGTSLSGGRGSIGGTIIGAFVIGVLSDGLILLGVSEFWQIVIKGLVIVLAVMIDQLQQKLRSR
ncbi:MAG: ABC transporter permease [Oscillochloris sp.]|nr:ABC transporter permease [Oscillochloris sp.]